MKKYVLITLVALLAISCNGQNDKAENNEAKIPKGTWKVDKEFDNNGNLIKYDSIYSWSSHDTIKNLSLKEQDRLMQRFRSKFFNDFSDLNHQEFEDIFTQDSLFSKHFFNDDFFESHFKKDFVNIDDLRKQMIAEQKRLMEKYESGIIKPEEDN
ncbi:hypothetical protein [uncultured Formosa sp.]|uniref:hypothetical protein n=1 Tax=uncultured Formosa sp. TaxID=255435 RepID=UPI00261DC482|nr:hypothetical protein [uncultured Formosa sp.]